MKKLFLPLFLFNFFLINLKASDPNNYYNFSLAEYHSVQGDLKKSLDAFNKITPSNSKEPQKELLRTLEGFGRYDLIIELKDKFANDAEAQLAVVQSYLATGKKNEGTKLLAELLEKNPTNLKIVAFHIFLLIDEENFDQALKAIDQFLASNPKQSKEFSDIYFLKAKILLQQEKVAEAETTIDTLLRIDKENENGWLLKAVIAEFKKQNKEAIKYYLSYLKIRDKKGTPNPVVQKKLILLLFEQEMFAEAIAELEKVTDDSAEHFFDLALICWKGKHWDKAKNYISIALEKNSHLANAKALKTEILFGITLQEPNKQLVKEHLIVLLNYLKDWIMDEPDNLTPLESLLALKKIGLTNETIFKILHHVIAQNKQSKQIFIFLADLYLADKNLEKSLYYYQKALELNNDETLRPKILYPIAYLNFVLEKNSEVEKPLKEIIALKKIYPQAYNLLAYFYASNNQNFDYAYELVTGALKYEPKNLAFLDTKGFILAKQGKIKEAVEIFSEALKIDPQNKIIKEHLLSYAYTH
ncbi:TPA: hypothetical protein DEO28_00095 [Candidatus Dependentiae bacterium]|nr:MAG: Tetratricopeptide TPR_2 repeat protein [candidate division TM6 bacterium GW2011_GWE2_31_21]KKP53997.1 MAG: Tetratricopeptide TPR_2 repeat protein [candidate division TM6 bacterium GW2011_GWF2_33_332]HBS48422.1 hypothetical protein [Candidatus Dependentiae bacterium]HBZ72904.1 hypothetical protein [Candidatus Dependentiae bacterium]